MSERRAPDRRDRVLTTFAPGGAASKRFPIACCKPAGVYRSLQDAQYRIVQRPCRLRPG